MRYLKTYKLFESVYKDDTIKDLRDMSLDIQDDGFQFDYGIEAEDEVEVEIWKKSKYQHAYSSLFKVTDDVKEYILRIKDYMDGWSMSMKASVEGDEHKSWVTGEEVLSVDNIDFIRITFKKL